MPTSPKALDYVWFEMLFECFVIKVKYSRLQALFLKDFWSAKTHQHAVKA